MPIPNKLDDILLKEVEFYAENVKKPILSPEITRPQNRAGSRCDAIIESVADLTAISIPISKESRHNFSLSYTEPLEKLAAEFQSFYGEDGRLKTDEESVTKFTETWNSRPSAIGAEYFPALLKKSGIELPPYIKAEELKNYIGPNELYLLTNILLPISARKNIDRPFDLDEFTAVFHGEIAKMLTDADNHGYGLELQTKLNHLLSVKTQETTTANSALIQAIELKARLANGLWQVAQPHRAEAEIAKSNNSRASSKLANDKLEPFDEMLDLVYNNHLEQVHDPVRALYLTIFELWKDIAE